MKLANKNDLIKCSNEKLSEMYEVLANKPILDLISLPATETALIMIDMINGFAKEGALRSTRTKALIPDVRDLVEKCHEDGIAVVAFADSHLEDSPEFESYPEHCVRETSESEVVDEIKEVGEYHLIRKNSTNSFIEPGFQKWLSANSQIKNFIVVGVCTDICIEQFSITLKSYFNMRNIHSRIIVPINMVDTFDLGLHYAELMNIMSLFFMQNSGVELVSEIV